MKPQWVNRVAILGILLLSVSAYAAITAHSVVYNFDNGKAKGWVFPFNSGMTQYPGGDWTVENGTLVQSFFGDNNAGLVENLVLSSQTVEAQVKSVGYAGIVLWYNQVDSTWANYVSVTRNAQAPIWVTEFIDGTSLRSAYDGPWWSGDWGDLKVEADSQTGALRVYVDDPLMGHYEFTHTVSTLYRSGLSGVLSGNHFGYFDNFRLTFVRKRGRPR